jgi:hypothetical protein
MSWMTSEGNSETVLPPPGRHLTDPRSLAVQRRPQAPDRSRQIRRPLVVLIRASPPSPYRHTARPQPRFGVVH